MLEERLNYLSILSVEKIIKLLICSYVAKSIEEECRQFVNKNLILLLDLSVNNAE